MSLLSLVRRRALLSYSTYLREGEDRVGLDPVEEVDGLVEAVGLEECQGEAAADTEADEVDDQTPHDAVAWLGIGVRSSR